MKLDFGIRIHEGHARSQTPLSLFVKGAVVCTAGGCDFFGVVQSSDHHRTLLLYHHRPPRSYGHRRFSVGYSRFVTPNTVVSLRFPHGGASGSTSGGAFTWYVRGTTSGGGGVNLRRLGLSASDWRDAIRVEAGKTYRIDLGERLVLYSVRDAKTGERHEAYIDFQKYPQPQLRRPVDRFGGSGRKLSRREK